ncbi:hypothetical protein HN51_020127 [Arachis hypogaea]
MRLIINSRCYCENFHWWNNSKSVFETFKYGAKGLMFGGNFAYVMKDVSLSLKQLILEIIASRMVTKLVNFKAYNSSEGSWNAGLIET